MLVETHQLSKHYGAVAALCDVSLSIKGGEVFGLLGPNGAGKTTLLRLLMGYIRPSSGWARISNLDCYRQSVEAHRLVSYLPGDVRMFRSMSGRSLLRYFAGLRPGGDFRRALDLAEFFELNLSRRVAFMSTGMRQKLALVVALSADVPLVILDEPTSSLDPNVRRQILSLVAQARQEGRTVLFSSHVLAEVEEACDRVAILGEGRLLHVQLMSQLRRQHRIYARLRGPLPPPPEGECELVIAPRQDGHVVIDTPGELAPLLGWLATAPLEEVRIEPIGLRVIYDRYHHPQVEAAEALPAVAETSSS